MIESYTPNRSAVLVRNPEWKGIDEVPDGNPDKMTFNVIEEDSAALQSVIDGANDYDFHSIPVDRLGEVQNQYADQLKLVHAGEHVLLLHEHAGEAVRQARGAAGRELRGRPRGGRPAVRRSRVDDAERAAADVPAVHEDRHVHARPREGEAARAAVGLRGHAPSRSGATRARRSRSRRRTSRTS